MLGQSNPRRIGLRLVCSCGMLILALTTSGGAAERAATTTLDCGANALFVLFRLEGRPVALTQLERALPPRRTEGHSMAELASAAAALGLPLDGARFGKGDEVLTRPAIAFFKSAEGGHFAVLRPVGTTGTMVQVIDPPHVPRFADYENLFAARSWTGRVLIRRDHWAVRNVLPLILALGACILFGVGLSRGLLTAWTKKSATPKG